MSAHFSCNLDFDRMISIVLIGMLIFHNLLLINIIVTFYFFNKILDTCILFLVHVPTIPQRGVQSPEPDRK